MRTFYRLVAALSQAAGLAAALMIASSIVVVAHMVFVRYVLRESTIWQTEFVTYALIAATFIGSPYVLLARGHVNVDLLPIYMGDRMRYALALVAGLIGFVFCALLTWQSLILWHEAATKGWRSETVWGIKMWIPYLSMPVGLGLLTLQYFADILAVLSGHETPFGMPPKERPGERP